MSEKFSGDRFICSTAIACTKKAGTTCHISLISRAKKLLPNSQFYLLFTLNYLMLEFGMESKHSKVQLKGWGAIT